MKKLLLIISLIFIQYSFGQQNFLKKSELRDSLDAYNFQNDGLNDSLALIRGEISDTSATLRQVIIDTASAIRTDIGGLNTAYVDSVANLKLDKSAFIDSVLARNLVDRTELDDTSQAIRQAIIDSSGAVRSYANLKLDKSALKDSVYNSAITASTSSSIYRAIERAKALKLSLTGGTLTGTLTGTTINATTGFTLNGTSINTTGTLSNVAYKGQDNSFTELQYIAKSSDGAQTFPINIRNAFQTVNTEVGIKFEPTNAALGLRYSAITAFNNGGNQIGLKFITGNAGTITEKWRIGYAGNLTNTGTDGTEKLDVTGNIKASGTVTAPTVNATTALQLNGADINTTGTLSNVAYKGQDNSFTVGQTIRGTITQLLLGTVPYGLVTSFSGTFQNTYLSHIAKDASNAQVWRANWNRNSSSTAYFLQFLDASDAFYWNAMGFDYTNKRVGINKTNPSYALDVTGSIFSTTSIITGVAESQITMLPSATQPQINIIDVVTGKGWFLQHKLDVSNQFRIIYYNASTYVAPLKIEMTAVNNSLTMSTNGVGILKENATEALDVSGNIKASGTITGTTITGSQFRLSALNTAPASATDTGATGEIRIVDGYIYVCVATNQWKRVPVSTWD